MSGGGSAKYSPEVLESSRAVFSLGETFGERELDAAYRKVALRCHPDKGGRRDLFDTVAECHRILRDHAAATGMWDDPDVEGSYDSIVSLRGREAGGSPGYYGGSSAAPPAVPRRTGGGATAFDVVEFNRRYEESRQRNTERDTGYADWMAKAAGEFSEPVKPVVNPKCGPGAFNKAFEKHTPTLDGQSGAIVLRPADASAGGLCGALLDDDEEVDDYTTSIGGGFAGADCRLAHSNQRLAAAAWARKEVRVDRASLGRLGAERDAEVRSVPLPPGITRERRGEERFAGEDRFGAFR